MRPLRFSGALKGIWRPPGDDLNALVLLQDLQHGNFFGERAILSANLPRESKSQTAVSVTHSELMFIRREKFVQMVEQFELHDTVKQIENTYRSRRARFRWRVAIITIKVVCYLALSLRKGKEQRRLSASQFIGDKLKKFTGGVSRSSSSSFIFIVCAGLLSPLWNLTFCVFFFGIIT